MATIDITEQAPGTQSSTFKIEDLEKARTFENKHFVILSVKMNSEIGHQVFLKSIKNKKTVIFFNQNKAPLCIKVSREFAQSWKLKKQAEIKKRDKV